MTAIFNVYVGSYGPTWPHDLKVVGLRDCPSLLKEAVADRLLISVGGGGAVSITQLREGAGTLYVYPVQVWPGIPVTVEQGIPHEGLFVATGNRWVTACLVQHQEILSVTVEKTLASRSLISEFTREAGMIRIPIKSCWPIIERATRFLQVIHADLHMTMDLDMEGVVAPGWKMREEGKSDTEPTGGDQGLGRLNTP